MEKRGEWWPNARTNAAGIDHGYEMDLRGIMAVEFVEKWGMVQGDSGKEDSAGRATIALMPVEAVLDRATAMAAGLIARLEALGWIRQPAGTLEQVAAYTGELAGIRTEHEYHLRADRSQRLAEAIRDQD